MHGAEGKMTQAYPLQWPDGWPRTKPSLRNYGEKFKRADWRGGRKRTTIAQTRTELADELQKLGAKSIVLSTNVELRMDGQPYSNRRAPDDPGIAVYFNLDGEPMVMAQDAYSRVPDNIRSLTLAISGMRQMQRHGGGTMLKRAFSGFSALPPPDESQPIVTPAASHWWDVLGVSPEADLATIKAAFRALCSENGGDATEELNRAYQEAKDAVQ